MDIIKSFIAFIINIFIKAAPKSYKLKTLENKPMEATIQSPVTTKENSSTAIIARWANAIAKWEGAKTELNNPGNLKYSTLMATWGATRSNHAIDGGNFSQFKTYEEGLQALCNFLILGCEDELKDFHNARTFEAFTKVYAGNPPQTYIQGIADLVGCSLDIQISTFLIQ